MRPVTGQATQPSFALPKTPARGKEERLMASVPGISQARFIAFDQGHAMTLAAQLVDRIGRQSRGIPRAYAIRIAHVRRRGAVTGFTSDSKFQWNNAPLVDHTERPRGVAAEAAQDGGGRIEHAVSNTPGGCVAGCAGLHRARYQVSPSSR
jgi:hypothetical protein